MRGATLGGYLGLNESMGSKYVTQHTSLACGRTARELWRRYLPSTLQSRSGGCTGRMSACLCGQSHSLHCSSCQGCSLRGIHGTLVNHHALHTDWTTPASLSSTNRPLASIAPSSNPSLGVLIPPRDPFVLTCWVFNPEHTLQSHILLWGQEEWALHHSSCFCHSPLPRFLCSPPCVLFAHLPCSLYSPP